MNIGEKIGSLPFCASNDLQGNFDDYRGQWLILYFYPKDSTPGCTTEGQNFRDLYPTLQTLNTQVLGVSRDSLKSHERFKCTQQFPFELISDQEEVLCSYFDVMKTKSMYGKQVRGIERSTFLIDPEGILRKEWRKVKVEGHADEVIAALKASQI